MTDAPTRSERRAAHRVPIAVPVEVAVEIRSLERGTSYYAFSRDVSGVGMFIRSEQPTSLGAKLEVVFRLPDTDTTMQLRGSVRRVVPAGDLRFEPGFGVEFEDVPPYALDALHRYVAGRT